MLYLEISIKTFDCFFIISFEIKSNPQEFLFFKELIAFEISALLIVLSNSENIFSFSILSNRVFIVNGGLTGSLFRSWKYSFQRSEVTSDTVDPLSDWDKSCKRDHYFLGLFSFNESSCSIILLYSLLMLFLSFL